MQAPLVLKDITEEMNQRLFFLYNYTIFVTWCVVSWRMCSCHRWAKDMLQALGSLAAPLIAPSLLIWTSDTITLGCLRGRDSKQRADHEIIYLAWILCGFFGRNPIYRVKNLRRNRHSGFGLQECFKWPQSTAWTQLSNFGFLSSGRNLILAQCPYTVGLTFSLMNMTFEWQHLHFDASPKIGSLWSCRSTL